MNSCPISTRSLWDAYAPTVRKHSGSLACAIALIGLATNSKACLYGGIAGVGILLVLQKTFFTKPSLQQAWIRCADSVNNKDFQQLQHVFPAITTRTFWHKGYPALVWFPAVELLNVAAEYISLCDAADVQDHINIFVFLHEKYADFLRTLPQKEKNTLQARYLILAAQQSRRDTIGNSQVHFKSITHAYVPECPHSLYITEESKKKIDKLYNSDQVMYAEWCYITALAIKEVIKAGDSFSKILHCGSTSRYWLGIVCGGEGMPLNDFGEIRLRGSHSVITPLRGRYRSWRPLAYSLLDNTSDYLIFAVGPNGEKIEGTKIAYSQIYEAPYWKHGSCVHLEQLHELSALWLKKVVQDFEGDASHFFHDLGMLYHTLVQYTPFKRGSATFSYTLISALLLLYQEKNPLFSLPQAVTLLDCYALTMQAELFVDTVFLPWCQNTATDAQLQARLPGKKLARK